MSTDYAPSGKIPFDALFDGRMAKDGINEGIGPATTPDARFLRSDVGGAWAYRGLDGNVCGFTCYMSNGNPGKVFGAIRCEFGVEILIENGTGGFVPMGEG
jgi:hypothetical protein